MAAVRVSAIVAVVLLAGCAQERAVEIPAAGADEVWVVGISHPAGDWDVCFEDDSVAESLMSADLPPSRAAATLAPQAGEDDVRRIVDCLDRALTGGDVSVGVTARRTDAG